MRGGNAQNYPEYEDDEKQDAARFLVCDIDARPVIRGIDDRERMEAWMDVAEELDVEGRQQRALRQRKQALTSSEEETEFTAATEIGTPSADAESEAAFADGGTVIEEDGDGPDDDGDEWEPREDQAVLEYGTDEEFQSELRSARGLAERYDYVDEVEAALEREQERDEWRPHVAQALEERLEVLEQ